MSEMDSLEVKLSVDASSAQKGAQQFKQATGETVPAVEKAIGASERLGKAYDETGKAAQETARRQQVTQTQYDRMQKKLEEYRRKLQEVAAEEAKLQKQIEEVNNSIAEAMRQSPHYNISALRMIEGLPELEEQLKAVTDQQIRLKASVEETESAMATASVGTENVSRYLAGMSVTAAAAIADLSGAGGLANAIRTTGQAINAFMLASGPQGMMIAGVTAGLSAISLVMQTIQAHAEKAKAEVESAKAAAESLRQTSADSATASNYMRILESVNSSIEDQTTARQNLASLFPRMVIGYTDEGEAILASNEAIKDQIELLQQREARLGRIAKFEAEKSLKTVLSGVTDELKTIRGELPWYMRFVDAVTNKRPQSLFLPMDLGLTEEEVNRYLDLVGDGIEDLELQINTILSGIQYEFDNLSVGQILQMGNEVNKQMDTIKEKINTWIIQYKDGEMSATEFYELLKNQINASSDAVEAASEKEANANEIRKQTVSTTRDAAAAEQTLAQQIQAAQQARDANRLYQYASTLKTATKNTKEWQEAAEHIAKVLGVSTKEIEGNVDGYADMAQQMALTEKEAYRLAVASINAEIAAINAQMAAEDLAGSIEVQMARRVEELLRMRDIFMNIANDTSGGDETKPRGGGSSTPRKAAWEEEMELIERVQSEMEDLGDVYVSVLERMLTDQRLSASERARIEKELEYANKAVAGTLQQDYIEYLENILTAQELNAEQRLSVERKLIQAQKDLQRQLIEELDALGNAVVTALRNKYEAERAAMEESFDAQIKAAQDASKAQIASINSSRDAQIKSINDQIKALDDLKRARDRANKDEDDEKRLAMLKAQLALEKDSYDQIKLQEQIVQLEKDIADRKEDERIEDEKRRLQDEIAAIRETSQAAIDGVNASTEATIEGLNKQRAEQQKYWEERLKEENLMAEALYLLQEESNENILQLLEDYNPEYLRAAQALGQSLYDGFNEKYEDLLRLTRKTAQEIINLADAAFAAWGNAMAYVNSNPIPERGGERAWVNGVEVNPRTGQAINPVSAAIYNSLEAMLEPRTAYYEQRAADAGMQNYAVADFDSGLAYGGSVGSRAVSSGGTRIEKIEQHIYAQTPSAYEQQKAARREMERWARSGWI